MEEKMKWLTENGYMLDELDGGYVLTFRDGNYGARNGYRLHELINMPLDVMKDHHEYFMSRARANEIF